MGMFILQIYICIEHKAERDARKGWSSLSVLQQTNLIRDPFILTTDTITRTYPSLSNFNIPHFHEGPNKNPHDDKNLSMCTNIFTYLLQKYIKKLHMK